MSTTSASSAALTLNQGDISQRIAARRAAYGGSDPTQPSFLRPQYVKYNAISKSRDFGRLDNLLALVSGTIGGNTGTQTLYFQVTLNGPADLRIAKSGGNRRENSYISVGILGPDHKPLALTSDGFAALVNNDGTAADESLDPLPAGTYTFTVSSSLWQSLPFSALLQVLRYRDLAGQVGGELKLEARLASAQLRGTALLEGPASGVLRSLAVVKSLEGTVSGGDASTGELTIPRGEIVAQLLLEGRIRVNWRISGSAGGELTCSGTISVGGGGGYG